MSVTMQPPWISVIIPCYNVEKYIDRCVKSLVGQTIGVEHLELIFVDDASTDKTAAKLKEWEARYPENILLICCDKNGKQGTARNIGMQYASTPYIGFVDADDWVEADMYEKMYQKAIQTGADVVGVQHQREDSNGKIYHEEKPYAGRMEVYCKVQDERYRGLPGGVWSGLYKKELIIDNDIYFPGNLSYEDNFWGGLLRYYVKSYYIIDEILYHYFVNFDSTIMQQDSSHHTDRLVIEKMKLDELKKRGFYEKDRDRIEYVFLLVFYINSIHTFLLRMKNIPYETICMMQKEVCREFPDFEDNPYLYRLNDVEKFFLKTVRAELSREDWEDIRRAYHEAIKLAAQNENKI